MSVEGVPPSISFLPALAPRYEYDNEENGQNRSSNFFRKIHCFHRHMHCFHGNN